MDGLSVIHFDASLASVILYFFFLAEAPLLPDPDDYVNSSQYDGQSYGPNMQYDPMMRPAKKPRKKKEKGILRLNLS